MAIASVNPATGVVIREFPAHTEADIESALERGVLAFQQHRRAPFPDRAAIIRRAAGLLEEEHERFARIISTEMGKVFSASVSEIEKCVRCCRFYADHGEEFLREQILESDARQSSIRYQPLGIVLAIMPWNFPFWQVFRFAVPALMAGNVALLKHASNVPQCALAIEQIFRAAGCEPGIFQTLLLETSAVEKLIKDRRVSAVTLTGSDRAGSAVASNAGRELKKCVLELGGSDPFIVMPSADVKRAVTTGVKARTINSGQSCIAAKRFIVADAVYDEFLSGFIREMKRLKLGDPFDPNADLGPLASEDILRGVERQVRESAQAGARILAGGERAALPGYFYKPTILVDIPNTAPAYREEVFGPVALIFRVGDAAEAASLANDSEFGLGSSVWTNDAGEREFFEREINSGMVFVNAMVASDPRLPFGGVKRSGYGRELGAEGIREFTNVKTIYVSG